MSNLSSALCPFPRIIHTTLVYPLSLYRPFFGFYFFNGLMCVLQVLQVFWAGLILRMVVKFLPGNVRSATFNCPFTLRSIVKTVPVQTLFFLCLGRTSSKTNVVTKRRRSQMMKVKKSGKNPKTATCRMATRPLTTTTGKGTDYTLIVCVTTGTNVWPLT